MLMARGVPRFAVPLAPMLLQIAAGRGTPCTVESISTPPTPPPSFSALIEMWPTMADFANETNQPYERVKRWRALNSIKAKYWPSVKAAAWARGWGWVDDTLLARLAVASATDRERENAA